MRLPLSLHVACVAGVFALACSGSATAQTEPPLDTWFGGTLDEKDPRYKDSWGDKVAFDCYVFEPAQGVEYSVEMRSDVSGMDYEVAVGNGRNCKREALEEDNDYGGDEAWVRFIGESKRVFIRAAGGGEDDFGNYRLIVRAGANAVRTDNGEHVSPSTLRDWSGGNSQPVERLLEARRQLSEAGDQYAQAKLGIMYLAGVGTTVNAEEAARWIRASAEQGFSDGEYYYGYLLHAGQGVAQDYAEAMRWYRQAAETNHGEAMAAIGDLYVSGLGVAQNFAEAARWYEQAAYQNSYAQRQLAYLYLDGKGVGRNVPEYLRRIRLAAEAGDAWAQYHLSGINDGDPATAAHVQSNPVAAFMWLAIALNQGIMTQLSQAQAEEMNAFAERMVAQLSEADKQRAIELAQRCITAGLKGCDVEAPSQALSISAPGRVEAALSLSDQRLSGGGAAYDCYALQISAGIGYRVKVYSSDFDTMVEIANTCEGSAIHSNDDKPDLGKVFSYGESNSLLDFDGRGGQVFLRVQAARSSGLGNYTVTINLARWQGVATTADYSQLIPVLDMPSQSAAEQAIARRCRDLGTTCETIAISREKCISVAWKPGSGQYDATANELKVQAEFDVLTVCGADCQQRTFCPTGS